MVGKMKFETRIKELVENLPDLSVCSNRCSSFAGCYASSSSSSIAACWLSFGTMRCAGA